MNDRKYIMSYVRKPQWHKMTIEEKRETTCAAIDVMIANLDKGISGFWREYDCGFEGCGNPEIFPEFNDKDVKKQGLISISKLVCPYDCRILLGKRKPIGHEDEHSNGGCYHHCADYYAITPDIRKTILERFKENINSGLYDEGVTYDEWKKVKPILTKEEIIHIEEIIQKNWEEREEKRNKQHKAKSSKNKK